MPFHSSFNRLVVVSLSICMLFSPVMIAQAEPGGRGRDMPIMPGAGPGPDPGRGFEAGPQPDGRFVRHPEQPQPKQPIRDQRQYRTPVPEGEGFMVNRRVHDPGRPALQPRSREHWPIHPRRPYGSVYRDLPAELFALHVAGALFFYHLGTFYRHTPEGYIVVRAPIGARVAGLPDECTVVYSRHNRYFYCDDVYYKPIDGGYVVVEEPPVDYEKEVSVGAHVWIRADILNVRSGPGVQFDVINQLNKGDVVEVKGYDRNWYYVTLPNGRTGWVMSKFTGIYRGKHHNADG